MTHFTLIFLIEPMPEEGTRGAVRCQFKVGDKVRVDLDTEILKAMQEGHGGWNPRMADVSLYHPVYFFPHSSAMT